jgi:hypothetical protein
MAERNLHVDHVTIWRWVQRYAPELNRRCCPELRPTNASWRVDETYLRVAGKWTYLYRAVDSTGATIGFLLSADGMRQPQSDSCRRPCGRQVTLPTRPVLEQHRGARPPRHENGGFGRARASAPSGQRLERFKASR